MKCLCIFNLKLQIAILLSLIAVIIGVGLSCLLNDTQYQTQDCTYSMKGTINCNTVIPKQTNQCIDIGDRDCRTARNYTGLLICSIVMCGVQIGSMVLCYLIIEFKWYKEKQAIGTFIFGSSFCPMAAIILFILADQLQNNSFKTKSGQEITFSQTVITKLIVMGTIDIITLPSSILIFNLIFPLNKLGKTSFWQKQYLSSSTPKQTRPEPVQNEGLQRRFSGDNDRHFTGLDERR